MLGSFGPFPGIRSLNATKQMFAGKTSAMSVEGYLEVVLFLMLLEREGET